MVSFDIDDTIAAVASAPGASVRGIVRISGPDVARCMESVFRADDGRSLSEYGTTSAIPGALLMKSGSTLPGELLFWPTKQSYTRQPTAEFHTVGSPPILQLVVAELCEAGARLAKPGEFTLRAFLSGRIDLTQAEAVLAVIDSASDKQMSTALKQLAGGLAGPLGEIRNELLGTLAELEAGLDFVEEDIEFISETELTRQLDSSRLNLEKIANQISNRDLSTDSAKVVLFGMPNSGKSSLFNALTGLGTAIVTDVAGTTTDFVSANLSLDSVSIELIDTAGIEDSNQPIMRQAQSHREEQQDQAMVRLFCIDESRRQLNQWEIDQLDQSPQSTIIALTKSDLTGFETDGASTIIHQISQSGFDGPIVETSSLKQTGFEKLRDQISISVIESQHSDQSVVGTTVLRAAESLREAMNSVEFALEATKNQRGEEIVAAEIRQALEGLGHVVGTVYTDDILDLVFGRFCIGK